MPRATDYDDLGQMIGGKRDAALHASLQPLPDVHVDRIALRAPTGALLSTMPVTLLRPAGSTWR